MVDVGSLAVGIGTLLMGGAAVWALRRPHGIDPAEREVLADRDRWRDRAIDCERERERDAARPRRRHRDGAKQ